ncbi:hypothetical protein MCUN1_003304 [Malassezia cuniculi]|uniref:Uncharacterized protein n=1 Tax=Malassezia cuniculi TaxID=948313 RepID=A0AAF0EWQ1_9BASI|nr:hypothetical protein MCUN1_003304 [Malassezia cuniculi]
MASQAHPVIETVNKADALATRFNEIHQATLPHIDALLGIQPDTPAAEEHHAVLREGLAHMESVTNEMTELLYRYEVYLAPNTTPNMHSFNPQQALAHVSDIFNGYQTELINKREALADYTCEEIDLNEFARRWYSMDEVEQNRKQGMDDLADLLAGF